MKTIPITEIKQNPRAAVERVRAAGEALEVTYRGRSLGVVLAPSEVTGDLDAHRQAARTAEVNGLIAAVGQPDPSGVDAVADEVLGAVEW